jgi:smad nuclear-interacting protein 1
MDLGSVHGTFLNGSKIDDGRYYELREKDAIHFGASSREYVLLNESSSGAK